MAMKNMVTAFTKVAIPHESGYRIVAVLDTPEERRKAGGRKMVKALCVDTGVVASNFEEADRICNAWTEMVRFKNAIEDVEATVNSSFGVVDKDGVLIEEVI